MNENEVLATETTEEVTEVIPAAVETPVEVVPAPETKKGLTSAQKTIGLGVIGFAIFGIIQLVRIIIGGVKKLATKFKSKKAEKQASKAAEKEDDGIEPDDFVEAEVVDDNSEK